MRGDPWTQFWHQVFITAAIVVPVILLFVVVIILRIVRQDEPRGDDAERRLKPNRRIGDHANHGRDGKPPDMPPMIHPPRDDDG